MIFQTKFPDKSEDEPDSPAADAPIGNQEAAATQAMGQAMSAAPSGNLGTPAAPAMMAIPGATPPSSNQESHAAQAMPAGPSGSLETPAVPAMKGIPGGGAPSGNQESAAAQVI